MVLGFSRNCLWTSILLFIGPFVNELFLFLSLPFLPFWIFWRTFPRLFLMMLVNFPFWPFWRVDWLIDPRGARIFIEWPLFCKWFFDDVFLPCIVLSLEEEDGERRKNVADLWKKNKERWDEMWTCCVSDNFSCCFCSACIFQDCWDCLPDDICRSFLDRSSFSSSLACLMSRNFALHMFIFIWFEWHWREEKLALLEPSVAFQHLLQSVNWVPRIFLAPANSGLTLMVCGHLAPACWGCLSTHKVVYSIWRGF